MVHRYRINRRPIVDLNGNLVTGVTTTFTSGVTFDNIKDTTQTINTSIDQTVDLKHLTIPIKLDFEPADNSELINDWATEQVLKRINSVIDGERITYRPQQQITINFRFLDGGTYGDTYLDAGFVPEDYDANRFTKSYFRLYFYDTNDINARLLFSEDLPVIRPENNNKIKFTMPDILWEREDPIMRGTDTNRDVYVNARFFNAKTGVIKNFINIPKSNTTPIDITQYSNNVEWRYSKLTLINPTNNTGEYNFRVNNGGGTTDSSITFSELDIV